MIYQTANNGIHNNCSQQQSQGMNCEIISLGEYGVEEVSEGIPKEAITFWSHDRIAAKNDKGNSTTVESLFSKITQFSNDTNDPRSRRRVWRMSPHITKNKIRNIHFPTMVFVFIVDFFSLQTWVSQPPDR
jgi:hypothetical protein